MMKNKLLLAASLLTAVGANAQSQSVVFKSNLHRQPVAESRAVLPKHDFMNASSEAAGKTTTGNTKRWYSYFETLDTFVLNQALSSNYRVIPIWFDSSVRQRYSTGYDVINYSSVYQVMDPINFTYFNSRNFYPGALHIRPTDAYSIDSIWIDGFYERLANKANVVDTLILSVSSTNVSYRFSKNQTNFGWISNYIPAGQDTLYGPTLGSIDSINRTAYVGTGTSNPGVVWKVPLYYADSSTDGKTYRFKVGGANGSPVNIPANTRFAITATFKSGDTWVPNVDSFNQHNNWRPFTSNTGNNTQMPYFWYQYTDRNMSGLMFSTDPASYIPSVLIEGINDNQFSYEFHSMGAKITCTDCRNVGVPGAMELIANATIFPNPANNSVSVPVNMKADANVTVSITNTMGQLLMSQDLGKVAGGTSATATFSTSELPTGMYFYTIEANGRRVTDRFTVAH